MIWTVFAEFCRVLVVLLSSCFYFNVNFQTTNIDCGSEDFVSLVPLLAHSYKIL